MTNATTYAWETAAAQYNLTEDATYELESWLAEQDIEQTAAAFEKATAEWVSLAKKHGLI